MGRTRGGRCEAGGRACAQHQLCEQPAARLTHAGVALEAAGGVGRSRLSAAAGSGAVRAGDRLVVLSEAGRGPLRPHARSVGQPRPHPRPQRPVDGVERAGAVAVGDPEGLRGRHAGAPPTGQGAGRVAEGARRTPRRQPEFRLAEAAGRRDAGQGCAGARAAGRAPVARGQAQVPRGRGGRARGRLHRCREPRPGRHRTRLPERADRPQRHPSRHQGPAGQGRRGHR